MVFRPRVHRSAVTYAAVFQGAAYEFRADGDHATAAMLDEIAAKYAAIAAAAPFKAA